MGRKSAVPSDMRVDAVLSLLRKQETATQIAQRAGVSEQTLYRWRDGFIAGGKAQLEGKSGDTPAAREVATMRREITMRDQVIGELTIANRNLEKLSDPSTGLHARSQQAARPRHAVNEHKRQILTQRR